VALEVLIEAVDDDVVKEVEVKRVKAMSAAALVEDSVGGEEVHAEVEDEGEEKVASPTPGFR